MLIILEFDLSLAELNVFFFPSPTLNQTFLTKLLRISVLADYTDVGDKFVGKSSSDHDS